MLKPFHLQKLNLAG